MVQTPGGQVEYQGDAAIDGVPGTAAPVRLNFQKVAGSVTGALLPTGNLRDVFDGVEVTCMDVAMPVVMARADAFGLTGYESREELDANRDFFARMEAIRLQAGEAMGMGDVSNPSRPNSPSWPRLTAADPSLRAISCLGRLTRHWRLPAPSASPPARSPPARWQMASGLGRTARRPSSRSSTRPGFWMSASTFRTGPRGLTWSPPASPAPPANSPPATCSCQAERVSAPSVRGSAGHRRRFLVAGSDAVRRAALAGAAPSALDDQLRFLGEAVSLGRVPSALAKGRCAKTCLDS